MPKTPKPKSFFEYALQIWLTSLLLGSLTLTLLPDPAESSKDGYLSLFFIAMAFAFMFSWPCLCLLWLGVYTIAFRPWHVRKKKLATAILSLVLAIALIRMVMYWYGVQLERGMLSLFGGYVLPLPLAVWVYRWPERKEDRMESLS